ncbi:hypothetical protein FRC09_008138 [Ceratobasidium sp. 395]|nr:hypothetical protein FRC09_008138 [Ceratobasidium sp. 395]
MKSFAEWAELVTSDAWSSPPPASRSSLSPPDPTTREIAILNQAAAKRRIDIRQAPRLKISMLLEGFNNAGRLGECVTCNVDGQEAWGNVELANRMTMLFGDNNVLFCPAGSCPEFKGQFVLDHESDLVSGRPAVCPSCKQRREEQQQAGVRQSSRLQKPNYLEPKLQWDGSMDHDFLIENLYTKFATRIRRSDTLLIVGASPSGLAYQVLIPEIARLVHDFDGAVVFLDPADLPSCELQGRVDFHLKMDIETGCQAITEALNAVSVLI